LSLSTRSFNGVSRLKAKRNNSWIPDGFVMHGSPGIVERRLLVCAVQQLCEALSFERCVYTVGGQQYSGKKWRRWSDTKRRNGVRNEREKV